MKLVPVANIRFSVIICVLWRCWKMLSLHFCFPQILLWDVMRLLLWRHCCRAPHTIQELVVPSGTQFSLSRNTQLPWGHKLTTHAAKWLLRRFIKHETWHWNNLIKGSQWHKLWGNIQHNDKEKNFTFRWENLLSILIPVYLITEEFISDYLADLAALTTAGEWMH